MFRFLKKIKCFILIPLYWYLTYPLYLMYCSYYDPFYISHRFGLDHSMDWAFGLLLTIIGLIMVETGEMLPAVREFMINTRRRSGSDSRYASLIWISKICSILGLVVLFLFHIVFVANFNYWILPLVESFLYIPV